MALTREREKRFQIIHAIYPRPYEEQKSKAARDMPWASCWVEKEAKAGAGVLRESGYPEFPAVVPRYLANGDVDLAAELANTVDDPFTRDRLLIHVAEKCAAAATAHWRQ